MQEQPYPFYKNRYFPHKRMRSADFKRDQELSDRKMAFLCRWLFGEGAALGLSTQRIDSENLVVNPGFAIDGQGRYIVVDASARFAVGSLKGLDSLSGENAVLWLEYEEHDQDPMLVPDENGSETNKMSVAREGFRLFLREPESLSAPAAEALLFSNTVLLADEELRVTQSVPKRFSGTGVTELRLIIECYDPETVKLKLTYEPKLPGFLGADGKAPSLRRDLCVGLGETILTLSVRPDETEQSISGSVPMTVDGDAFVLERNGQRYGAGKAFHQNFPVTKGDPAAELMDGLLEQDMDDLWTCDGRGVALAYVRLIRLGNKCLLDEVTPVSNRYRVPVPWLRECMERVSACYGREAQEPPAPAPRGPALPAPSPKPPPKRMTTGTVTLDTGLDMEDGRILCSEELTHELGPGPVLVEFGIENVYPVANDERNRTDLLLGDPTLFSQPGGTYDTPMDRGVRVHPEKGTFELAVRLRGRLRQTSLRLRWFAWRPEEATAPPKPPGKLLRLKPDMIRVSLGKAVQFTPVFAEGAAVPCEFFVEGRRSGSVTRDGIYTAPDRPGLFIVYAREKDGERDRVAAFVIVEDRNDGAGS